MMRNKPNGTQKKNFNTKPLYFLFLEAVEDFLNYPQKNYRKVMATKREETMHKKKENEWEKIKLVSSQTKKRDP